MPKFIQKYQCLFCGTLFNTEEKALEHEKSCRYNPETKKCGTCKYYVSEYYGNWICDYKPEDGSSTYEYYDESLTCPYHKLDNKGVWMTISKELLENIIDDKVKYYCVNINEIEYDYVSLDRHNPLIMDVNDFFFRCKEWALKNWYKIDSSNYKNQAFIDWYDENEENDTHKVINKYFYANSEQQAVFDACQWILENKKELNEI